MPAEGCLGLWVVGVCPAVGFGGGEGEDLFQAAAVSSAVIRTML